MSLAAQITPSLAPRQILTATENGNDHFSFVQTLPNIHQGSILEVVVSWNQPDINGVIFVNSQTNNQTYKWKRLTSICKTTNCEALYILTDAPAGSTQITVQFNITGPGVTYQMLAQEIPGP